VINYAHQITETKMINDGGRMNFNRVFADRCLGCFFSLYTDEHVFLTRK